MRMIFAASILAAGGCLPSTKYRTYPENPFSDLRRVVLLPIANQTRWDRLDTQEFGAVFASEMVKFPGFEVVRPGRVVERIESLEDALRIARGAKADAFLAVAVTDADPYDPPRMALSLQLFRTRAGALSAGEIDRLIRSGTWRTGPFPLTRGRAGNLVDAFQRVWDAHEKNVRDEIRRYADAQEGGDTAYRDEQEFLAVQSRWTQFVANQAWNELISRARSRGAHN